jgi:hypothetical protein|tara:strand:+ start:5737 stop:5844 length:108 start_codon:yes stop_codon:yes gene_type:complete
MAAKKKVTGNKRKTVREWRAEVDELNNMIGERGQE